jgi:hypothetical protein
MEPLTVTPELTPTYALALAAATAATRPCGWAVRGRRVVARWAWELPGSAARLRRALVETTRGPDCREGYAMRTPAIYTMVPADMR